MRNLALPDAKPNGTTTSGPGNRPRSSDRVLQLLCAVGSSAQGMSLTEAAADVGLVPSTALRQLRSLEAAGLLTRNDDQVYRAGPQLIELSRTVFVGWSLVTIAQPFLDELAHVSGETAYLAVAETERTVVYVATSPGVHALRHSGWVGRGFVSSSTAVGEALRGRVDQDGVVSRVGKVESGITAVGAPVRSTSGIVAAVNLVGPSFRMTGEALTEARRAVAVAAGRLSATLGQGVLPF